MSMDKSEIIKMVLELYSARKEAKEYLDFYAEPNAILTCSHPILVHIYLDDADSVTQHFLHLLKDGVHHLAWLAPGGEEIDQDKLVT